MTFRRILLVVVLAAVVGAAIATGVFMLVGRGNDHVQTVQTPPPENQVQQSRPPKQPAAPNYDTIWNRCFQDHENDIAPYPDAPGYEFSTSQELGDYCREVANNYSYAQP